ncbi:MAG: 30S ribosomal protein S12 methylthiotransferase RimO [Muribaculaceae bacterium]|nr:30S ribosomal protein S12 methylthiotransferase RimO [Muribaculaceae bacterium]
MVRRVSIISLGCSKNLVDSERLAKRFEEVGYKVVFVDEIPSDGSVVVVNTCGFIGDAKEESINVILEATEQKKRGKISALYAMGCLTERYRLELKDELPELDGIYGKFDWTAIVDVVSRNNDKSIKVWERVISTAPHYTYIKISEGCNRFCAFCAIPLITGRHHSRPVDEIIDEVRSLAANGTREFNIIAQDLSSYGKDLADGNSSLACLISGMAEVSGVEMIRLHYAYPSEFPYDILPVMAKYKNVCNYIDIALQHIDDRVLSNMRRHITADETRALLSRIRKEVPGIHIRTTMMVGFPGEDDAAFENLLEFVAEQRFERLGAFAYCEEEGTFAATNLKDEIPESVKQQRLDRLMELQQEIAFDISESKVGTELDVIIDSYNGKYYVGRSEYDSPEVDCNVYVEYSPLIEIGRIYRVEITAAEGFDLIGKLAVK